MFDPESFELTFEEEPKTETEVLNVTVETEELGEIPLLFTSSTGAKGDQGPPGPQGPQGPPGESPTLVDASETESGIVNTIAQTFAGIKTFVAALILRAQLATSTLLYTDPPPLTLRGRYWGGAASVDWDIDVQYKCEAGDLTFTANKAAQPFATLNENGTLVLTNRLNVPLTFTNEIRASSGSTPPALVFEASGRTRLRSSATGDLFAIGAASTDHFTVGVDGRLAVLGVASGANAIEVPNGAYIQFGTDVSLRRNPFAARLETQGIPIGIGTGMRIEANGYTGGHSAWVPVHNTGWALGAGATGHTFNSSFGANTGYITDWQKDGTVQARITTEGRGIFNGGVQFSNGSVQTSAAPVMQIVDVTLTTHATDVESSFPIDVLLSGTLGANLAGCHVIQATNNTDAAALFYTPVFVQGVYHTATSNHYLRIRYITGLQPGTSYTLKLMIVGTN